MACTACTGVVRYSLNSPTTHAAAYSTSDTLLCWLACSAALSSRAAIYIS